MIATDITGTNGAGGDAAQVFSLLAVVADPAAYKAKIDALVKATEEHKKYVELVSPASEVLAARAQIDALQAQAKQTLADAQAEAETLKAQAQEQAQAIVAEANAAATKTRRSTTETNAAAKAKLAEAEQAMQAAQTSARELEVLRGELDARAQALAVAEAAVAAQKVAVQVERDTLIEKHRTFIESI